MANQEHLDILKQGVEVWNKWREDNPGIEPDLGCAKLQQAKLSGVNLKDTMLMCVNFTAANLQGADLCGSCLRGAVFLATNLRGANLSRTSFLDVSLGGYYIGYADLSGAVRLLTAESVTHKESCLNSDMRIERPASRSGTSWGGKPADKDPDLRARRRKGSESCAPCCREKPASEASL